MASLRERLARREEVGPEVPSAVGELIRSEGLYRTATLPPA